MTEEERKNKQNLHASKWRHENPEKFKLQRKKYYEKNKELLAIKNKEKKRIYSAKYREKNPYISTPESREKARLHMQKLRNSRPKVKRVLTEEQRLKYNEYMKNLRRRYNANKPPKRKRTKEERDVLFEQKKERRRIRERNKRKDDYIYLVSCRYKARIRKLIRDKGFKKESKTAEMLGCSFEKFKQHIENLFLDGMNWDNRSEWHIDHIIPISCATTIDGIKKLSHYKNFRPMWAIDNIKKSNHLILT